MSNDTSDFRGAFNSAIEAWRLANYPDMVVVYENGPQPANEGEAGPMFLDTSVRWYGASPSTVGTRPRGRHTGALALHVFSKQGQGVGQPGEVIDSLVELLRNRRLGSAVLSMPQLGVPGTANGWSKLSLFVPFRLDSA